VIERVGRASTVALVAVLALALPAPAGAQIARGGEDEFSLRGEVGKEIARKGRPYKKFATVRNETDELEIKVPAAWDEVSESRFVEPDTGERFGAGVILAPDLDKLRNTFDVPGFRITATENIEDNPVGMLLDDNGGSYPDDCTSQGVESYDDGRYEGEYEFFTDCEGGGAGAVVVAAQDVDGEYVIVLSGQVRTRADLVAIDKAIRSSRYEPDVTNRPSV
jgi:hypothetical protein